MQQFECNDSGPDVNGGRKSNFERASSIRLSLRSSATKHITPTRRSALDDKYLGGLMDTPNKYLAVSRNAINRVRGKSSNRVSPFSIYALKRFVRFSHIFPFSLFLSLSAHKQWNLLISPRKRSPPLLFSQIPHRREDLTSQQAILRENSLFLRNI